MFTLNILLFISAALIVGYASYLLSTQWNVLSTDNYIPIIMFVLFAILLIVSCLGSVATCRLSRCLLIIYSLILAVCLILQVVVIVLIVTSNFNTDSWLEDRFNDLSTDDKQLIEKELECCGWNETVTDPTCTDYTDYCQTKVEDYAKRMKLIGMILGAAILVFEVECSLSNIYFIHIPVFLYL